MVGSGSTSNHFVSIGGITRVVARRPSDGVLPLGTLVGGGGMKVVGRLKRTAVDGRRVEGHAPTSEDFQHVGPEEVLRPSVRKECWSVGEAGIAVRANEMLARLARERVATAEPSSARAEVDVDVSPFRVRAGATTARYLVVPPKATRRDDIVSAC